MDGYAPCSEAGYIKELIGSTVREHPEVGYMDVSVQARDQRDFMLLGGKFTEYDQGPVRNMTARFWGEGFGWVEVNGSDAVEYMRSHKGYSPSRIRSFSMERLVEELVGFGLWKVRGHLRNAAEHGAPDVPGPGEPQVVAACYESPVAKDPFWAEPERVEERLREYSQAASEAGGDGLDVEGDAVYSAVRDDRVYASSAGSCVETTDVRTLVRLDAFAWAGGEHRSRYRNSDATRHYGGEGGLELLDGVDLAAEGRRLGASAAAQRRARPVEEVGLPATFPVVLDGASAGVLAHEAVGHMAEADQALGYGGSAFTGRRGQRIVRTPITVVDDPTLQCSWGGYAYDSDGVAARRTVVVRDGVLEGYLTDVRTASELGEPSNGHGRAMYAAEPVVPRMSNTYIEPGDAPAESLLEGIELGLYVAGSFMGAADPRTGDVLIRAQEAYVVREGRLAERVSGVVLSGNTFEILDSVTAVGDEGTFELTPGFCGKGVNGRSQSVPVCTGGPALRVERGFELA